MKKGALLGVADDVVCIRSKVGRCMEQERSEIDLDNLSAHTLLQLQLMRACFSRYLLNTISCHNPILRSDLGCYILHYD